MCREVRNVFLNPTARENWKAGGKNKSSFLIKVWNNVSAVHTSININVICCHNVLRLGITFAYYIIATLTTENKSFPSLWSQFISDIWNLMILKLYYWSYMLFHWRSLTHFPLQIANSSTTTDTKGTNPFRASDPRINLWLNSASSSPKRVTTVLLRCGRRATSADGEPHLPAHFRTSAPCHCESP